MCIVHSLKENLSTNENVLFGYLFGSCAKNEQTQKSDVDVALFLKEVSLDTKLQVTYELSKLLSKDIDLVVLNDVKNIYLLEDILKNSLVIKDSSKRFDFEILKQHDILDYKVFRKYIDVA